MRGYEGGGDDEEEEKDERLRPREMLSLSTPINSGPGRFMVQYITAMMHKVMTSDDPEVGVVE